jgi:hypothetical protein
MILRPGPAGLLTVDRRLLNEMPPSSKYVEHKHSALRSCLTTTAAEVTLT